ncbi:MAG: leucine-rich repeat protein, partial [Lachnospiraceae bacterium]|nr:leucine-rich repeat protein [Lachnospiraceae bacterium]
NKDVITEIRNPATVTLRKEADHIEIESGTTYIGEYEFAGYANVKSVVIPEGVTEIGVGAFSGCTSLENVSFPSTLKKIERRAFDNCPNLREVVLPDRLEELGDSAFIECRFVKTGHWDKEYDKPETITEYNTIIYRGINLVNNVKPLQPHYDEETLFMEDAFELVKQSVQPENQRFTEDKIATVVENIDNITKISSTQIDNVKQTLSDNRESIQIQVKEQTLENLGPRTKETIKQQLAENKDTVDKSLTAAKARQMFGDGNGPAQNISQVFG